MNKRCHICAKGMSPRDRHACCPSHSGCSPGSTCAVCMSWTHDEFEECGYLDWDDDDGSSETNIQIEEAHDITEAMVHQPEDQEDGRPMITSEGSQSRSRSPTRRSPSSTKTRRRDVKTRRSDTHTSRSPSSESSQTRTSSEDAPTSKKNTRTSSLTRTSSQTRTSVEEAPTSKKNTRTSSQTRTSSHTRTSVEDAPTSHTRTSSQTRTSLEDAPTSKNITRTSNNTPIMVQTTPTRGKPTSVQTRRTIQRNLLETWGIKPYQMFPIFNPRKRKATQPEILRRGSATTPKLMKLTDQEDNIAEYDSPNESLRAEEKENENELNTPIMPQLKPGELWSLANGVSIIVPDCSSLNQQKFRIPRRSERPSQEPLKKVAPMTSSKTTDDSHRSRRSTRDRGATPSRHRTRSRETSPDSLLNSSSELPLALDRIKELKDEPKKKKVPTATLR